MDVVREDHVEAVCSVEGQHACKGKVDRCAGGNQGCREDAHESDTRNALNLEVREPVCVGGACVEDSSCHAARENNDGRCKKWNKRTMS